MREQLHTGLGVTNAERYQLYKLVWKSLQFKMEVAGSSMLEPTERSNQVPYIGGRGIAFETSELTQEDVDAMKQQGLTPTEQNEEGYTIFTSDHNIAEAEIDSEGEVEDEEEEDEEEEFEEEEDNEEDDDEESGAAFRGRITPSTTLDWQERYVIGTNKLPGKESIKCDLTVKTALDRNDPDQVKHLMKLDFLKLELPDCVNNGKQRGHFVHRIIVNVAPTEEWRTKINRMYAMPSDDSQRKEYTNNRSRTAGVVLTVGYPSAAGIQGEYSVTKDQSYTTGEHEWTSAEVDDSRDGQRWSVTWTWNLLLWGDGQPFNPDKPWRVKGYPLPNIPYKLPRLSLADIEHNWAEWSTSCDVKGTEKMEWDVRVKFCTVSLQRHVFKHTEFVKFGPEQITPTKGKISGVGVRKGQYAKLRSKLCLSS